MSPTCLIGPNLTLGDFESGKRIERNRNGIPILRSHKNATPSARAKAIREKHDRRIAQILECRPGHYVKTGCRCWYCGVAFSFQKPQQPTLDHIVPRCKGGKNTADNIVPACVACNSAKGHTSIEKFRELCGGRKFYGEPQEAE